jgi:hypothetical protein
MDCLTNYPSFAAYLFRLNQSQKDTVVLIFAANASTDAISKKMVSGTSLFEALTIQTVDTVKATGLPYIIHGEEDQRGDSFGDRFQHAINKCFKKGFKNVIAVGNDTPQLHKNHFDRAIKNLQNGDITVGKSTDGGFYLMAINDLAFAKANSHNSSSTLFSTLDWQKNSLLVGLKNLLAVCADKIHLLETLSDIDSVEDARSLLKNYKKLSRSILILLSQLLQDHLSTVHHISYKSLDGKRDFFNKGSPLAA